jgi:hypothetical protein
MANPNIYQQFLRPVRSVADYSEELDRGEANALSLAAGRREGAMQEQDMAQKVSDRNALQRIAQQYAGNQDGLIGGLEGSGSPALMAQAQAMRKARLEGQNTQSQIDERGVKTAGEKQKNSEAARKDAVQLAASFATPDDAIASMSEAVRGGKMPMQMATAMERMIRSDPQWQLKLVMGANSPEKMTDFLMPHLQTVNAGGYSVNQAVDKRTGKPTETGRTEITQSADNRATVGASMANAAATRDAAKTTADATRAAANTQRDQATEMKMADDYRAQSKEFGQSASAHKQLSATLDSATTSPAATLAAATKFMKILDPGSVVRESELGMALAASGVIDRAMNYVSTLQSGKKLTKQQAADFKDISNKMFVAAQQVQQTIDADYKGKAKAYGVRPEMVTQELGQNAKAVSWGDLK